MTEARNAFALAQRGIRYSDTVTLEDFGYGIIATLVSYGLLDQDKDDRRAMAAVVGAALAEFDEQMRGRHEGETRCGQSGWSGLDDLLPDMATAAVEALLNAGYLTTQDPRKIWGRAGAR